SRAGEKRRSKEFAKKVVFSCLSSCLIATEGQAQIAAKVACKELPALNTKQRGTATARFLLDRKSFQLAQFFLAFSRALLGRRRVRTLVQAGAAYPQRAWADAVARI